MGVVVLVPQEMMANRAGERRDLGRKGGAARAGFGGAKGAIFVRQEASRVLGRAGGSLGRTASGGSMGR